MALPIAKPVKRVTFSSKRDKIKEMFCPLENCNGLVVLDRQTEDMTLEMFGQAW